jgi:hypothetical protein
MTSFLTDPAAIPVKAGATASVPAVDGATDAEHIHYVYVETPTPAWVRTPLDTHYIWPQVANWAELSTRSYAINNDEVHVHRLGNPSDHSSGTAQKHGGGWRLIEGRWASEEDMIAWEDGDILNGARGLVDPDNHWDEDAVPYYYNGSVWLLAGGPSADAKAITEIELGQLEEPGQGINNFANNYTSLELTETP